MIPESFEYQKANTVDEAIEAIKDEFDAKIMAGGHSLLPAMKLRLSAPSKVVDISKIKELKYIKEEGDTIVIGATSTHHDIATSDVVKSKAPLLAQAAGLIGDIQVRNKGTIGGALAHADPAADYPASMLALEATFALKGPNGERIVPASDFFTGLFMTALEDGEILTEIRIPALPAHTASVYTKFMQPASRYAIVGCAAIVTKSNGVCDDVKVAFTSVGETAFRDSSVEGALKGKAPDSATIEAASSKAAEGVDILEDHFASEKYRKHLAKIYAKRALTEVVGML